MERHGRVIRGDHASMSHLGHVLGLNKRNELDSPRRVKKRKTFEND